MVIFSLVSVPISMLNELNHFAALLLSSSADYLRAFETDQLHTLVNLPDGRLLRVRSILEENS